MGEIRCASCGSKYPILAGVAVLVSDVHDYLCYHVKGISPLVRDSDIPREHRDDYIEARKEIQTEHIEEDLEATRVTALYVMNHYLAADSAATWWKPEAGPGSVLIDRLVREHWDHNPLAEIGHRLSKLQPPTVLELGCGVGGLLPRIREKVGHYLGVDSSFSSIALARHLAMGQPYAAQIRFPRDLLQGTVSNEVKIPVPATVSEGADFVVGDADSAPTGASRWDAVVALNLIDMLDDPASLPRLQKSLLKDGGLAIQSCPYIWHERAAKKLRRALPEKIRDSAQAIHWIYAKEGLTPSDEIAHLPWLFFKHIRQLEIYSVHLFTARKDK